MDGMWHLSVKEFVANQT